MMDMESSSSSLKPPSQSLLERLFYSFVKSLQTSAMIDFELSKIWHSLLWFIDWRAFLTNSSNLIKKLIYSTGAF